MQENLLRTEQHLPSVSYAILAKAADISDVGSGSGEGHQKMCLQAAVVLLQDRAQAAQEEGFAVVHTKLLRPDLQGFKADMLVGVPEERAAGNGIFCGLEQLSL